MAGKNTFLHGLHASRVARFLPPVVMPADVKQEIESALGRNLLADELAEIERIAGIYRGLRDYFADGAVDMQSVKRTLAAITKLSGEAAQNAYRNCDSISKAYIQEALYFDLNARGENLLAPAGNLVNKAAECAGLRLPQFSGRNQKGWQKLLAWQVLNCWRCFDGHSCKAWASDSKSSPLNQFAVAVFSIVEGYKFDPASAAKRLREAAKQLGDKPR